jgi:hypothetical protein
VFRSKYIFTLLALAAFAFSSSAQNASPSLDTYFTGKEVVLKIDMPGSQKGVDLRFNKSVPMVWKEYASRTKQFGVSIRKGDTARVTNVVIKKDMIEFQLDGGGFGTFGDDTATKIDPKTVDKSDYEKDLERQISETDDDDRKRSLQRDLDRERARRARLDDENRREASYASQQKAQEVASKRMQGGSRFNLRWQGSIPAENLTPEAVERLLVDYVDFNNAPPRGAAPANPNGPPPSYGAGNNAASGGATGGATGEAAASPTAQLQRGMKMSDVVALLGEGKQLSESTSAEGLKTQVVEYITTDRRVEATFVDALLVRFAITSR